MHLIHGFNLTNVLRRLPFILITVIMIGCEENEPDVHELVGRWKSTSGTSYYGISIEAALSTFSDPDYSEESDVVVFKADNTGTNTVSASDNALEEFEWSTSGSDLTITVEFDGESESLTFEYEVSNNTLTIISHDLGGPGDPEEWYVLSKHFMRFK